jgi:hypothetical protein
MSADDLKSWTGRSTRAEESSQELLAGPRVGWLTAGPSGTLHVDFEDNRGGPVPARSTVPLSPEELQKAIASRQGVVLLFEKGDPALPLVVGLVQTVSATPLLDVLLESTVPAPEEPSKPEPVSPPVEAHVDGKRVSIEGADEVVLRCGQASITLRRNGKVIIKGSYVETHAAGVNRIKGGSVQVN